MRAHIGEWRYADITLERENIQIITIGDIHGHSRALRCLIENLGRARDNDGVDTRVVFLGDIIDRGPDSRGCMDIVSRFSQRDDIDVITLMGNHESMFLAFLDWYNDIDRHIVNQFGGLWMANGGAQVVSEYFGEDHIPYNVAQMLGQYMTDNERNYLSGLQRCHRSGNVVFVHAGLSPYCIDEVTNNINEDAFAEFLDRHPIDVPQNESHYLWIRSEFLGYFEQREAGPLVVHGHTPVRADRRMIGLPYNGPSDFGITGRRLNLDGGSYGTGVVTGAVLQNGRYRLVWVEFDI